MKPEHIPPQEPRVFEEDTTVNIQLFPQRLQTGNLLLYLGKKLEVRESTSEGREHATPDCNLKEKSLKNVSLYKINTNTSVKL